MIIFHIYKGRVRISWLAGRSEHGTDGLTKTASLFLLFKGTFQKNMFQSIYGIIVIEKD